VHCDPLGVALYSHLSASATLGSFAVLYINDSGNSASNNLLLLLAAAGVAQQSQGYQLERDAAKDNALWPITISFMSADLLQGGEFAVVRDYCFCSANLVCSHQNRYTM